VFLATVFADAALPGLIMEWLVHRPSPLCEVGQSLRDSIEVPCACAKPHAIALPMAPAAPVMSAIHPARRN
jgi:hypothetical protein